MRESNQKSISFTQKNVQILIGAGILITLIYTPWFSKDSLAVPKQTLLFMTAMFFLPKIIFEVSSIIRLKYGKLILVSLALILIQLILVIFLSGAPIEQQIYGRDGRLLGVITFFSVIIIFLTAIRYIDTFNLNILLEGVFASNIFISIYAVMQSYGVDFFKWESRTNQVISTLGNPNYVSAFTAMALLPSIVYVKKFRIKYFNQVIITLFTLFTIYRTQSIQGFIAVFFAGNIYLLIHVIYRYRRFLPYFIIYLFTSSVIAVSGTLDHGPLSNFLYKVSVQSRGDFWRSAWNMVKSNPVFGVGLDSFGENYLKYRDEIAANHVFAEFTDSAHNYLLDYAAFGGIVLLILHGFLIALTVFIFIRLQLKLRQFNENITSIFAAWCAIQSTLFISPISLPALFWSNIFSGAIIGIGLRTLNLEHGLDYSGEKNFYKLRTLMMPISAILALFLMLPLINSDRLYLRSLNTLDGNLGIKVVNDFPRSTQKYATVGRLLFESAQYKYSLEVAKNSIVFNSKTVTGYALIMANPLASYQERTNAKNIILTLDPFNKEVPEYQIVQPN